jgi:ferritin-like metal-binding protein YciE
MILESSEQLKEIAMADTAKDAKLSQYLTEAYGKEKELETALQAHIGMTTRAPYKKRLQQHLKETKEHARLVERRLKKLNGGGIAAKVVEAAGRGTALAKGPLHALRGTSELEKQLKNAKTEYSEEHEEIATYIAIEALAEEVGDKETAKMARDIRRDEERMASFLERQIPVLTKAVARDEIPASERNGGRTRKRSKPGSSGRSRASSRSGSSRSSKSGSKSRSRSRSGSSARGRSKSGSGSRSRSQSGSGGSRSRAASRS